MTEFERKFPLTWREMRSLADRFNQLQEFLGSCGIANADVDGIEVTALQRLMFAVKAWEANPPH